MSIKAQWHLEELLGIVDDNPFDSVVLSSGLTVDLTGSEEEIYDGMRRSLEVEAKLYDGGVTCDLKDNGQDCLTCAMYVADRAEEPRAPLCRLGRDQRLMENRHGALRTVRIEAPFLELAALGEEMSEMAPTPTPEYEALLTAVGI
jgi:hypothetical protein